MSEPALDVDAEFDALPYGHWVEAVLHAIRYKTEGRRYPGGNGRLIDRVEVWHTGDLAKCNIVFEDGKHRVFVVEGGWVDLGKCR